jgi:hypothetical protein
MMLSVLKYNSLTSAVNTGMPARYDRLDYDRSQKRLQGIRIGRNYYLLAVCTDALASSAAPGTKVRGEST